MSRKRFDAAGSGCLDVSFPLRPGRPTCGRCDVVRLDWPSRPPRQRGGARPGGCVQRAETRTAKARRGGLPNVRYGRRRSPTGRVCPPRGLRAPAALARTPAPLLSLRRLDLLRSRNHGGRSNRVRRAGQVQTNWDLIATCRCSPNRYRQPGLAPACRPRAGSLVSGQPACRGIFVSIARASLIWRGLDVSAQSR